MQSSDWEFTSTEEIENFDAGDTAMDITGYVEAIEGIREVRTSQGRVLKFILNNGSGKRIRVLIWGQDALKWSSKIVMNQIIEITMGTIGNVNTKFNPVSDGMSSTEFHVQSASKIIIHGEYKSTTTSSITYKDVTLEELSSVKGPVAVEVFIRNPFVTVYAANASFGTGLTVQGIHKLPVQIANFTPDENHKQGVCVKLLGEVACNRSGGQFLKVQNMKNVIVVEGKEMSVSEMKKAIISVFSKRYSNEGLSDSKRLSEDKENEQGAKKFKND